MLNRTGLVAGLLVGAVALAACSSSKSPSSNNSTTNTPTGSPTSTASTNCATGTLKSDGSTAQANAMAAWISAYQAQCSGATINYAGGGSGQGVTDFSNGNVDFAGSDSAMTTAQIATATAKCGSPAVDLPMVVGPIGVAYNLAGVSNIKLTPKLIAQIFLGKITSWNDPAIKAENSGLSLPSTAISVVFRSDQSGTTQNFEKYLKATDPTDFTATPSKVWAGSAGAGKSGSQGVEQAIKATPGAIGYIEFSYAVNGGLSTVGVDTGSGTAVTMSANSAAAAVAAASIVGTGSDLSLKLDYATTAPGAYPIILVTYELACTKYSSSSTGALVKSFLNYTATSGQSLLVSHGYAPLPASIASKVVGVVGSIS